MHSDVETPATLFPGLISQVMSERWISFSLHIYAQVNSAELRFIALKYLEDVFSGFYVCDVDPLAVNVVAVGVPAAH